jgi:heat shock protein HtpX
MAYEPINKNKRNAFFLMLFFMLITTGLGYFIGCTYFHPYYGVIGGFVVSALLLFVAYYYGGRVILTLSGAVPADRGEYTSLIAPVESLALKAGIRVPDVYVIESGMINAFSACGKSGRAAIAVTTGAFKRLDKAELEAVAAHEMIHIKNYDTLTGSVAAVLVGTAVILPDVIKENLFRNSREKATSRKKIALFAAEAFAAILAPISAMIINYAVSRQREYPADAGGVVLTGDPQAMINALTKIKNDAAVSGGFSRGMEHLYFSTPAVFKGKIIFSAHPPLDSRIARIEELKGV